MSLEPITKKDIENLFNKILRVQINRQRISNYVIPVEAGIFFLYGLFFD